MLTANVRPPIGSVHGAAALPIRYFPPTNDYATGYGRLSLAITNALSTTEVGAKDGADLSLTWPGGAVSTNIRFTMWEPDAFPRQALAFLQSQTLIVPCEFNRRTFMEAGFKRKIHVVPLWGEAEFSPLPDDSTLRFICVARENGVRHRKRIDDLIAYFLDAFPHQKDVFLTVKSSKHCFDRSPEDSRIHIIRHDLSLSEYNKLLSLHHCGVFLSGLEAWNFPACELMAAGRPSILIPHGGPAEFTTADTSWYLDHKMTQSPEGHPYYGVGRGAHADRDSVIAAFRECYMNRGMLRKKSEACRIASKKFTKEMFTNRIRHVSLMELGRL